MNTLVYQTLSQATSQDANILKPAEEKLREWETQPGFYPSLCKIIRDKDLEVAVRWLGCVCLKNGIDKYYRRHAPNCISDVEKFVIRSELLNCLDEPTDAIALQLAVIIAKIARLDWPREWPNLIEILMNGIRSNESEVQRYRCLLILSHVIKTLSTKRLMGDKKYFYGLTTDIFPIMYDFWNFCVEAFLSANEEQRKSIKYKCDLEMSLLSAKILLKLTVFGYAKPHTSSHVINFMANIFDRMKTLLQFRLSARESDDRCRLLIEKHALTLIKVLSSVLDTHPYSYVDFIAVSLQHSSFYCFTKEGHGLIFDMLLIRWLNLMKAILQCPEYKASKSRGGEMENEIAKVKDGKDSFFTTAASQDICYKLVNDYFVLNERDLEFWDSDPEGYAAEEISESSKYNLRPCVEALFVAFLSQYKDTLIPIIVAIIESNKTIPNPDDMSAILKKDAVYNMFGLSVFDLFDEIDFDKWFTDILVPELHVKSPNYRILRRRIPWLIGRWNGVKLSNTLRPQMYAELIDLLETSEDMAVRLTVANTIKDVVDDFEFRGKVFLEHIPRCFQLLYALLEQSKECETKMQVLNVLSFIIERVGWEIAPFFDSLVNYLPMLWQHAEGHNMLRCAIVSVLTQIVRGLGDQCVTLEKFVIPVLEYSMDMEKDGHVYLQEDGLHLFLAYVESVKNSEDIFSVYHYLLALIEKSTENLRLTLKISNALLLLSPDTFIQSHAHGAVQTCLEMLPDLKSEGLEMIFEFFESCIKVRPYQSVELLQSFLRDSIVNITSIDDKPTVYSARLAITARIILSSHELFAQLVETTGNTHNISVDILFTQFLDTLLGKIVIVWPLERRKLIGLALLNLLTAGSNIVLTRFSTIIAAVVEILNDVLASEEETCTFSDTLLFNGDSIISDLEDDFKTEHETRFTELTMTDPVHRVDILWYFQTQLEALQKQVGDANFQQLMTSVTPDTINQLTLYMKKSQ